MLDSTFPSTSNIETGSEQQQSKELSNGLWNTIKSGMKTIKHKFPHLYFHLYGSGTSDKKGGFKGALRMEGNGLIYQPASRIKWNSKES
ncbi:MAG: hypothetical protein V5789_06880 [Colwellia sp.]